MILFRNVQLALPQINSRHRYIIAVIVLLFVFLLTACRAQPSENAGGDEASTTAQGADKNDEHVGKNSDSQSESSGGEDAASGTSEEEQGQNDSGSQAGDMQTPEPEVTPAPQKEILLCMGRAPTSLFPYKDSSPTAEALRYAIYEPLITNVGYEYQAHGLERLPRLLDGDASIQVVEVNAGERVIDSLGNVVTLQQGVSVVDSGGEVVTFDGTAVEMEQMQVEFSLKPMTWSDGTPVTAEDSVYSFELASADTSTFRSSALAHTDNYEATGERTLLWTGLPGLRDQKYFTNVWPPLPRHEDIAVVKAGRADEETAETVRLSSGPFVIDEWREDGSLVLLRNPHYYRQEEGLPFLDKIIIHFGVGEDFLAGEHAGSCEVITSDALSTAGLPLLEMAAENDNWEVLTTPGVVFENIAFGVNPVSEYADRRPDWFEDARVRQAMLMCTNRGRMVEELAQGHGQIIHSYLSPDHPLLPEDMQEWPYDPNRANALLDEAGYLDFAEDGRRQDVTSGVPMTITLGTNSESPMRLRITEMIQEDLGACGIPVETYNFTAGTWYASGPTGRLFGRKFDLASFAWLAQVLPDCGLYLSSNISGPEEFGFGGWQNVNVTGWSNEAFDEACGEALAAMPGGDGYDAFQQEALRIFAQEVPAMPLFTNYKIAAVRSWVLNAGLDSSQGSMLWNISEWDVDE